MKRIIAVITLFIILIISASFSFAQAKEVLKDIKYSKSGSQDKVTLYSTNYKGYKISYLPNPDRIVVDIPNSMVTVKGQKTIKVNGIFIKNIRYAQFTKNSIRVVLDITGKHQYKIEEKSGSLTFILQKPASNSNATPTKDTETNRGDIDRNTPVIQKISHLSSDVIYTNDDGRIYFSLKGTKLTEMTAGETTAGATDGTAIEAAGLKMLYSESYDESGKKYTISFPSSLTDIGSGIMQINDGVLDSVEIANDEANQTTHITFNARDKFVYEIVTNHDTNNTEIIVLKPNTNTGKLVVIDAGHGGKDPGAEYKDLREKDLNLKIALKLNEILKIKGINTYMTRTDDSFISLDDRATIANDLNATLFLSIHNNAFNSSECGTETLYYPSIKGKEFAFNIQNSLVKALGTKNRGIIERPKLVVLHATKMTAVIAEIAFLTNTGDRAKLSDEEFLQNTASAFSDAIIKSLGFPSN